MQLLELLPLAVWHLEEPLADPAASLVPDPIRPESLWSCMQCLACVEICPVGIEHLPILIGSRRGLVSNGDAPAYLGGPRRASSLPGRVWFTRRSTLPRILPSIAASNTSRFTRAGGSVISSGADSA